MPREDDPRFGPGGQFARKPGGVDYAPPQLTLEAARAYEAYDRAREREKAEQFANTHPTPGRAMEPWQTEDRIAYNQARRQREDEARRMAQELRRQQEARLAGVRDEIRRRMAPAAPLVKARDYYGLAGQAQIQDEYQQARANPPMGEAGALVARGDQEGYKLYQRAAATDATQSDLDRYQQHLATTQYSQGDYGALDLWRAPTGLAPLKKVTGAIGAGVGKALLGGTAIPGEDIGRAIGEGLVPEEVWQLALELAPGIGTVPGVISAVRKGTPEAILAGRKAAAKLGQSEAFERVLQEAASERGALTLGPGDEAAKAAAGAGEAAGLPAAADNLPLPPETAPTGLLSEQGDVIRLTRKKPVFEGELNPLQRHYKERNLAPEVPGLDKPLVGEAPEPRLQPPLGLLDDQGNIIDPLDPQVALIRQAFGGEAPTVPPGITPALVREALPTWNRYAEQLADSQRALGEAIARRKALDTLYQSPEQRSIRTAQRAAAKQGLTGDTSSAVPKALLDEARNAVTAARQASDAAKEAMKTAHIRVGDEDILRRLDGVGVDEKVIKDVQTQFAISRVQQAGEADFLTMPGVRKRLEQVYSRLGGNLSGPVGRSVARASNLNSGLNVWVNDFAKNYLSPMQRLLDQQAGNLRFVGDGRYAGLADTHRLWYVFTHPEDFRGITPAMHKLLNQAEAEGKAFYQGVRQFDPLNTTKPVSGRYLPQMWEDGIDYVERFGRPRGKAFITKQRAWKDWREALLSDQWSKELADMTPGQALEYAHRAAAQQMSDFYMRRDILKAFGSRTQKPGMLPFDSPMYKGWYAKPEIVSQVDAFFQPAGDLVRPAARVLQPIKNIRYGIDFAIWGYNVLHTLASGNVQITAGLIERALHGTGLRTIGEFADEGLMIQHGLAARGLESPFQKVGGTPLGWIPALRGIDTKATTGLDWLQHTQYSNIMGPLRHLVAQGNVALERATGELTASKLARAMDNANAVTGTSRGAQRPGRAAAESVLLGSARITRSQVAMLGQLVKVGTPETIATLASYGVTIGLVGAALDRTFGDGRGYTFSPFSLKAGKLEYNSEWATVSIKGRRYALIPQAALARAIAKSMASASQMDPNAFSTAWAQYGYTRVTPGLQGAISATTGAGFAPGKPFSPFGGLSAKERLLSLAPIPVAGTSQLDSSERGIRQGIESTLGLTAYSSVPSESQKTTAAKATAQQVLEKAGWTKAHEQGYAGHIDGLEAAGFTTAGKYKTIGALKSAFADATAQDIADRDGIPLHSARTKAQAEFEKFAAVKAYRSDEAKYERDFWMADKERAQQAWDQNLDDGPDADTRKKLGIK